MGAFDDADVVSTCGGNDEKLCAWWLVDIVSTGHMPNIVSTGHMLNQE